MEQILISTTVCISGCLYYKKKQVCYTCGKDRTEKMEGFEITNYLKTKIMPRRTEVNAEEIHGKGM